MCSQAEAAARASGKPPPTESWWQKELEAAEKEAQMEDDDDDAYFRYVGASQSVKCRSSVFELGRELLFGFPVGRVWGSPWRAEGSAKHLYPVASLIP